MIWAFVLLGCALGLSFVSNFKVQQELNMLVIVFIILYIMTNFQ